MSTVHAPLAFSRCSTNELGWGVRIDAPAHPADVAHSSHKCIVAARGIPIVRTSRLLRVLSVFLTSGLATKHAAVESPRPVNRGLTESVEVNLVIVDVQVLDRKGSPVPGLVAKDFGVTVDNKPVPIVSFDAACAELSEKPDLVLAFDYQHLGYVQRAEALDSAQRAFEHSPAREMQVMVVALTGGLRVVQPFTGDRDQIPSVLRAMRNDSSLFAGTFSHTGETGFVQSMSSLFDVVATVHRPKAILLYSAMTDLPFEAQFRDLAAMAATSRSVVYPIDVRGVTDPGVKLVRPRTKGESEGFG